MLTQAIKQKALELGFDAVGIAAADPLEKEHIERFERWLQNGFSAQMKFLHRNADKRFNPQKHLHGAQSVICAAVNYRLKDPDALKPTLIAHFAVFDDYHRWIKERLARLCEYIQRIAEKPVDFKILCDSSPLAERALAQRAGLGFIGKNACLIHPRWGCQILLGEIITTLPLKADTPLSADFCANCDRCIRACPAGALNKEGILDANQCISAQTQGYAQMPQAGLAAPALLGCDRCLLVCPYHQKAPPANHPDWPANRQRMALTCQQASEMSEQDFENLFKDSCAYRLGLARLKENARQSLKKADKL